MSSAFPILGCVLAVTSLFSPHCPFEQLESEAPILCCSAQLFCPAPNKDCSLWGQEGSHSFLGLTTALSGLALP